MKNAGLHKASRLVLVSVMSISLTACSGFEYLSNKDLAGLSRLEGTTYESHPSRNFGGLRLGTETEEQEDDRIFMLKREKSRYMADTVISKKDKFRSTHFSVGVDHKKSAAGFEFKFTF